MAGSEEAPSPGTNGAAAPAPPIGPVTLTLSVPIQAHGEELTSLRLRPCMPDDVSRVGYPFDIGPGGMHPKADLISEMIARLGGVPLSSVGKMALPDWHEAMFAILGFFGRSDLTV